MSGDTKPSSFTIFGRDVLKIPCFRDTFLYSISSYFGVGLVTFLATSKPAFSSHVGFASFVVVTFGYFTDCRLKVNKERLKVVQIQKAMQEAVAEGTNQADLKKKYPVLEDV